MPKPVVAIDFDDVVGGFNWAYYQWHNREYGTSLTYQDITSFDMCKVYGVDEATNLERTRIFVHQYHHEIQPIDGVHSILQQLSEQYELHIVTSRCESLHTITMNCLKLHNLEYFKELHFTNGFNSLFPEKKRKKLKVCTDIGAVALIEDSDTNAFEVAKGGIPVLMPERPWNGNVSHVLITRFSDWSEVTEALMEIA